MYSAVVGIELVVCGTLLLLIGMKPAYRPLYVENEPVEETPTEWLGATEEWHPKEDIGFSKDPWIEQMNDEDERFLTELDHKFVRLMVSDPDVDADYEAFVQRSMKLQAYRDWRLEHTQEIPRITEGNRE